MKFRALYALPVAVAVMIFTACASIGRPEGGARDEDPPVFVRSTPGMGERGVYRQALSIFFDENVQLEDPQNKIIVSPAQMESPRIIANGKRISVQLLDSLKPNTTYTVDFGDAIKDLNEGNVLDGFALDFSTGATLDTMRVSGIVLDASNLEPAQGIVVGAYSNLADSSIRTLVPDRVARTNQRGQFTIRNLAPGTYRIYAFKDLNRDWHWDRSEDVAFLDSLVVPSVSEITVTDTLYSSTRADSLIERRGVKYLPNDLLLTWFNQNYKAQYLKDYKRPERRRINVVLGAPADTAPELRIVSGVDNNALIGTTSNRWALTSTRPGNDSLNVWLTDPSVIAADSLMLSVRYKKPDSLDRLVWTTDTLRFFFRDPKRSKKEIEADTLPPTFDNLRISFPLKTTVEVFDTLALTVDQPLLSLDTAAIHLSVMADSLWVPVKQHLAVVPDSLNPLLNRHIPFKFEPGAKYRLQVDSAAFVSVYGQHNKPFKTDFTVRALEEYANLRFVMTNADSTARVVLLNNSDKPVRTAPVVNGTATFHNLNPGDYYARMYFDTDGNGRWSTGMLDSLQPEEVAYYPKKIVLKRNWDVDMTWDIYELPIDMQKPYAILKNKPKLRRGEERPKDESDQNPEDEDSLLGSPRNSTSPRSNMGGTRGLKMADRF